MLAVSQILIPWTCGSKTRTRLLFCPLHYCKFIMQMEMMQENGIFQETLSLKSSTNNKQSKMSSSAPDKRKAQLKAERRAKQEAQRAAKGMVIKGDKIGGGGGGGSGKPKQDQSKTPHPDPPDVSSEDRRKLENSFKELSVKPVGSVKTDLPGGGPVSVHPAFVQLGLQSGSGVVSGSDARCIALIAAFKKFILDYQKPSDKAFGRDIETAIRPHVSHLSGGNPLPPAIGNIVKQLKHQMTHLPTEISEKEGKEVLCEWLEDFVQEKIHLAFEAISLTIREKLGESSVIMTYSWSAIIEKIFIDAKRSGWDFRVVIVDSAPDQSGKVLLRNLLKWDIECSYALLNSLAYAIQDCKLVLIGADAMLANGSFIGPMGTSHVTLMAEANNVPVLAVCPTYKFAEKVQTGTLESETQSLLCPEPSEMIPADLVSGVVTELRILPPSSVPAVLRVKQIA